MQPARRPQPIRDSILAFLSEPRSARAIAEHIDRPVPTATGHLAAMRRLGLVLRLGYAAYARADYDGPPVDFSARVPASAEAARRLTGGLSLQGKPAIHAVRGKSR